MHLDHITTEDCIEKSEQKLCGVANEGEELQKQGTPFPISCLSERVREFFTDSPGNSRVLQSLPYFVKELSLLEQNQEKKFCVQSTLQVEFQEVPMCILFASEKLGGNQFGIGSLLMYYLPFKQPLDDQTTAQ